MENPNTITVLTGPLTKATFTDGAVPADVELPNSMRPSALVTSLTTTLEVVWYNTHLAEDALRLIGEKIHERTGYSIESHVMVPTQNEVKSKADITLSADAADLHDHAKALNGIRIPDLGHGKVFFAERLNVHIAIDSPLYRRHHRALKDIASRAWNDHKIQVKIFNGALERRERTIPISIKGNGRDNVSAVKAAIDGCISAVTAEKQQRKEEKTSKKHGLRWIYTEDYRKALDGGIDRLREFYLDDAVTFNDNAHPPIITIETSDNKFAKAMSILLEEQGLDVGECSICAEEEAELVAVPGCKHSLCNECLNTYCNTDVAAKIPLRCHADCDTILPIRWLEENLSPRAFLALCKDAVAAHLQHNPSGFVTCAGQDCSRYLAIPEGYTKEICPSCFTVNCTSCRSQYHFGETCKQRKARTDPQEEALEAALAEMGAKRCPGCGTPSEKIDGCNHMMCTTCGIHYCWVCLRSFEEMGAVYRHLTEDHDEELFGNAFDEALEEAMAAALEEAIVVGEALDEPIEALIEQLVDIM